MLKICRTTILASSSVYLPPLIKPLENQIPSPCTYLFIDNTELKLGYKIATHGSFPEKPLPLKPLSGLQTISLNLRHFSFDQRYLACNTWSRWYRLLNETAYRMERTPEIINYILLLTSTKFDPTIPHLHTICTRDPYIGQYIVAEKHWVVQRTTQNNQIWKPYQNAAQARTNH